jgi:MFS family permease
VQPLVMSATPVIVFIGGILSTQLSNDPSLATVPLTVLILGVASSVIPATFIAKKFGRRKAALIGFSCGLCAALLAMTAAIIASFEIFIVANFLFGTSAAFIQQLRFAAIESTPVAEDLPKVLSVLMLSGIFAAFLGPEIALLGRDVLDSPHGYAGSFLLIAALTFIAMLLMRFFIDAPPETTSINGEARSLNTIIKQPIFIISLLSAVIGYAVMSYLMTATPISMHKMMGHSLIETKWVIQSHIAAMFIPSFFAALLIKKIGLKGILFIGTFLYAIVAFIAFSGQDFMHFWWALVLLGIGWNFLFLTGTTLLPQSYQSNERYKVQALNDFILFGFQAVASLLAGWVLFNAGWTILVLSSIPFILILFLLSWYFYRYESKQVTKKSNARR